MKDPTQAPELKRFVLPALFVGALFLTLFLRRPDISGDTRMFTFQGPTMGTAYTVKVVAPGMDNARQARVDQAIITALDTVNSSMSTYLKTSELSKFNAHQSLEPFEASPELIAVFEEATRVSRISKGAFDITVGPLVDAWGFGPDKPGSPPSPEQIALLRESVGYEKLQIETSSLTKRSKFLRVDLSAIAKGFALDQVQAALEGLGYGNFMIEVGGEVVTRGTRLDGRIWRIGIERPDPEGISVYKAIELDSMAMASSGDYRNYREIEGKRISHTIDPRNGQPVTHRLASVTVLHQKCMSADALATMFSVMGPEEGFALAQTQDIAAFFLVRDKDGTYSELQSDAFKARTKR